MAGSIVGVDDRSSLIEAINRIKYRDSGNASYPALVIWTATGTSYPLILAGASTNHLAALLGATSPTATPSTSNAVLLVQDAAVSIGAGKELRLYNVAGSNVVVWKHNNSNNDVLQTPDGVLIGGALNVGSAVNATDAGDAWIESGLVVGTYSNPPAGFIVASGDIAWKSGTAFSMTFQHNITADRTVTFQDAAGTVALLGAVNAAADLTLGGHLLFNPDATYDIGASGATRPRSIYLATSASVGTNPASAGAVRLANAAKVASRNAGNSADINLIGTNASDNIEIGVAGTLIKSLGNPPAARAYHNAAQAIADSTFTKLAFNSERYDYDTIHDTATNNSRLTCKTAGVYVISGSVSFASNTTGIRRVLILVNNTTYIADQVFTPIAGGNETTVSISTQYALAVNDYVELQVYQTSTGSLNVNSNANYSPEFMMTKGG